MTYAVAAVALAVAVMFIHPAIIAVVDELRDRRRQREINELTKELSNAVHSGNLARVVAIRERLRKLGL